MPDARAEAEAARARFDAAALIGHTADEAAEWCREHEFAVLIEPEGAPVAASWSPVRVRLTVRDGVVIAARLG
jgi:hypothetical protein